MKFSLLPINILFKNKILQSQCAKAPKGKSYEFKENACSINTAESTDLPLDPSLSRAEQCLLMSLNTSKEDLLRY